MRINFDRICKLAGVSNNSSSGYLNEGSYKNYEGHGAEKHSDPMEEMNPVDEYGDLMEEEMYSEEVGSDEKPQEEMAGKLDEMVEVDIGVLMSEIRRAKAIAKNNRELKHRNAMKKRKLQENHLKRVIAHEVQNILEELDDHGGSWVYGNRKPRHSKKGYTNQGRMMPGIGFRDY